jgi:hypothetical protein
MLGAGGLPPRRLTGRLGGDRRWVEALGDQPHGQDHLLHGDRKGQDGWGRSERGRKVEHDEQAGDRDQRRAKKAPNRQPSRDESRSIEHPVVQDGPEAEG